MPRGKKLYRLKRTLWLAQPKLTCVCEKTPNIKTSITKQTTKVDAKDYCPTENLLKLAEPKPFRVGRAYQEHLPECCLTFVSPNALKYKGLYPIYFSLININQV